GREEETAVAGSHDVAQARSSDLGGRRGDRVRALEDRVNLVRDTKGSVFVETLVGILVPIVFFFVTWQLVYLFTAQLILKHAAVVSADYQCHGGWLSYVCGGGSARRLTAEATMPYQGAKYSYLPN